MLDFDLLAHIVGAFVAMMGGSFGVESPVGVWKVVYALLKAMGRLDASEVSEGVLRGVATNPRAIRSRRMKTAWPIQV